MELETKIIHKNKMPMEVLAQMIAEDDYNLPSAKPDVAHIIKSTGNIVIEEVVWEDEYAGVKGKMNFSILYQGEGTEQVLDCVSGAIPFQERVHTEGWKGKEGTVVTAEMEDLGVVVINSRKLSLRALAELKLRIWETEELKLPLFTEYSKDYQAKEENCRVLKFMEQRGDRVRFRQEIPLPKEKPNIQRILWQNVRLEQVNQRQNSEGIELSGMLCAFVLYETTQQEGYVWYETSVPVSAQMDCEIPGTNGFFQIRQTRLLTSLEPREDLDGELRNISVECSLEVELMVWQEEEMSILADAYCMSKELHVHRHTEELWQVAMKNETTIVAEMRQPLPEGKEILSVCDNRTSLKMQEIRREGNRIIIRGTCEVETLYRVDQEEVSFACERFQLPFEGEAEVGNVQEGDFLDSEALVYRTQSGVADGSAIQCRIEVQVRMMAFHRQTMDIPDDIVEEPLDLVSLQKQPGLIGYVVKEGDDLWTIAKKFHTTKEDLVKTNDLPKEELQMGQKILVMKRICRDAFL